MFNLTELAKLELGYIERCFKSVCNTNNFLELNFNLVSKVLANSQLHVESELQVLYAAKKWLMRNNAERRQYAKDLLLKVRILLFPSHNLNNLVSSDLPFNTNDCVQIVREVSQNIKTAYQDKPNNFFLPRFCTQDMFNIIITGGLNGRPNKRLTLDCYQKSGVVNSVVRINLTHHNTQNIYCRGNIYAVGGYDRNNKLITAIGKCSLDTHTWEQVGEVSDNRERFCAIAFMDNILIMGGRDSSFYSLKSCFKFDTNDNNWYQIAQMTFSRASAACAVFEGKIVVSGGSPGLYHVGNLKSVEAYDPLTKQWTSMPNMIESRCYHTSVAYKNKMFVIGSKGGNGKETMEVFDSSCNKFVLIKPKPKLIQFSLSNIVQTFSIGSKLITLGHGSPTYICYDVENNEWSEEPFQVTEDLYHFGCALVPKRF